MSNPVLYIFVRKDLQMSAGKIGAQTAQAAIGAWRISDPKLREEWWNMGQHHTTIVLEVDDRRHLDDARLYLHDRGFETFAMRDEGATEVPRHTVTCMAAAIVDKGDENVLKTFSSFDLYREIIEAKIVIRR